MSLKLNVGVSRKVGQPDYGSIGASCNLELELEVGLIERDVEAFHARVRAAYVAVRRAVNDELARLQTGAEQQPELPTRSAHPVLNGRANGEIRAGAVPAARSRQRRPATENQLRAIRLIAAREGVGLDGLLRERRVNQPEDLSLRQASDLIGTLRLAAAS